MEKPIIPPLSANERFKNFNEEDFRSGDRVFYRHEGQWQEGVLDAEPEKKGQKVLLKIQGVTAEIESFVPPSKIEFAVGQDFKIKNDNYEVLKVQSGPDGEVLYDLEADITTTTASGATSTKKRKLENIDQTVLFNLRHVEATEKEVADHKTDLLTEIKKLKSEARGLHIQTLLGLEKKVNEMYEQLGAIDRWSEKDAVELADLLEEIKKARLEVEEAVRALEAQVGTDVKSELAGEAGALRSRTIRSSREKFDTKMQTKNDEVKDEHKRMKELWREFQTAEKDWSDTKKIFEKNLADARRGRGTAPEVAAAIAAATTTLEEHVKNKPTWEDYQPELKAWKSGRVSLEKKLETARASGKKAKITTAEGALSAYMLTRPKGLDGEPELELSSSDKKQKVLAAFEIFEELSSVPLTDQSEELKALLRQVERDGQALVKKSKGSKVMPAPSSAEYKEVVGEVMLGMLENFDKTKAELESKFDINKETKELQDKIKEMRGKINSLVEKRVSDPLKTEMDAIETDVKGLAGLYKGDDDPETIYEQTGEEIIDIWGEISELEIKIFDSQSKRDIVSPELETKIVDIPPRLMSEILMANVGGLHEVFKQVYDAVSAPDSRSAQVVDALKKFIADFKPTEAQRAQLASCGISNWEHFCDKWRDEIVDKFAGVLLQMSDSEVRAMVGHRISDIRYDKKQGGFFRDLKVEWWEQSSFSQMKGTAGLRFGLNMGALLAVGVGTGLLTKPLPGLARAGIVGAAVGATKVFMSRFLGVEKLGLEKQAQDARAKAEQVKKKFITDQLLARMFVASGSGTTPTFALRPEQNIQLGYLFSTAFKRATEGEDREKNVPYASKQIILKGEQVVIYNEALRRASFDEGLDVSDEMKFKFAEAIHALHNNDVVNSAKLPPLMIRAMGGLMQIYAGKGLPTFGTKPAESVTGAGMEPSPKPKTDKKDVSLGLQLGFTTAMGASVGALMASGGATTAQASLLERATASTGIARAGIGFAMGELVGQKSQYERDKSRLETQTRDNLEKIIIIVNGLLEPINTTALTPEQVIAERERRAKILKNMNELFLALRGKTKTVEDNKTIETAGSSLKDFDMASTTDPNTRALLKFFVNNNETTANFVHSNRMLFDKLGAVLRDISDSGYLETLGFRGCLETLKNAGDKMTEKAKDGRSQAFGRWFKRNVRGALYGIIGGTGSFLVGEGVNAALAGSGFFGSSDTPAGEPPPEPQPVAEPQTTSQPESEPTPDPKEPETATNLLERRDVVATDPVIDWVKMEEEMPAGAVEQLKSLAKTFPGLEAEKLQEMLNLSQLAKGHGPEHEWIEQMRYLSENLSGNNRTKFYEMIGYDPDGKVDLNTAIGRSAHRLALSEEYMTKGGKYLKYPLWDANAKQYYVLGVDEAKGGFSSEHVQVGGNRDLEVQLSSPKTVAEIRGIAPAEATASAMKTVEVAGETYYQNNATLPNGTEVPLLYDESGHLAMFLDDQGKWQPVLADIPASLPKEIKIPITEAGATATTGGASRIGTGGGGGARTVETGAEAVKGGGKGPDLLRYDEVNRAGQEVVDVPEASTMKWNGYAYGKASVFTDPDGNTYFTKGLKITEDGKNLISEFIYNQQGERVGFVGNDNKPHFQTPNEGWPEGMPEKLPSRFFPAVEPISTTGVSAVETSAKGSVIGAETAPTVADVGTGGSYETVAVRPPSGSNDAVVLDLRAGKLTVSASYMADKSAADPDFVARFTNYANSIEGNELKALQQVMNGQEDYNIQYNPKAKEPADMFKVMHEGEEVSS